MQNVEEEDARYCHGKLWRFEGIIDDIVAFVPYFQAAAARLRNLMNAK